MTHGHYLTQVQKGGVPLFRQQKKNELKELIFSTSLELFKEKGYEAVSVDEITQACGIAKGTFYNYFPKKEAILLHLGNSQMEAMLQTIEQQSSISSVKDRLYAIFNELFAYIAENRNLVKIVMFELIRSQVMLEQESAQIQKFQFALTHVIKEGIERGEMKESVEPTGVADTMVALYFQTVMSWLSLPNDQRQNLLSMFLRHFEILWEGIGNT